MSAHRPPWQLSCPQCGAENPFDAQKCWLCGELVQVPREASQESQQVPAPPVSGQDSRARDFGISWVILVLTILVLSVVIALQWPGVGIALVVVMTPILIRAAIQAKREFRRRLTAILGALATTEVAAIVGFGILCAPLVPPAIVGIAVWLLIFPIVIGLAMAAWESWSLIQYWMRKE